MKKFLEFSRAVTWQFGQRGGHRNSRPKIQKRYHVNYQLWFNVLLKRCLCD